MKININLKPIFHVPKRAVSKKLIKRGLVELKGFLLPNWNEPGFTHIPNFLPGGKDLKIVLTRILTPSC